MPSFFRHPAIPPRPTRVEGEDSREYVEKDAIVATYSDNLFRVTLDIL